MRGVIFKGNREAEIREFPDPHAGPGEAVVAAVFGSWTFSKAELLEIARFMVEARVPLQKLITHRYDLDQAVEAFRTFDGATTGKCVFVMN